MWSTTLANFKENLNKIAQDVHDDDDEEEEPSSSIYHNNNYSPDRDDDSPPISNRRHSNRSGSFSNSPLSNGIDSAPNSQIEHYKAEIKKLRESEAEIKALSVNYAALLKEKEDYISRLNEENGSLKQNMANDQSPNRLQKAIVRTRSIGSPSVNGPAPKQDGFSNGISHSKAAGVNQSKMESKHSSIQGNEKELALLEERNRSLAAKQSSQDLQIRQLSMELDKERGKLSDLNRKLQDEQKINASFQEKLNSLKLEKEKTYVEMNSIRDNLSQKSSEINRLQMELSRKESVERNDLAESLRSAIAALEKENSNLKREKEELNAALRASAEKALHDLKTSDKFSNGVNESSGAFIGKEEMELSLQKLEKELKEACREKEKTLQQLNRLKQHLLDKESEDSEKMDEDSKLIEELRAQNENQRAQILPLEKALKQAIASHEEVKMINNEELQRSKEIIDDLNKKLSSCFSTIDAKNVELLNLQTALGQYYAEIEAKEHLEEVVALAREESARLSELLKDAHQQAELLKRDKEETLAKLSEAERMIAEGRGRVNKIEEDNAKLRRALEQSMTRLNRMSMDSDYFVDRRIVIKLLVTYFQRNHSKEVLDLMVRMLGFSDEDKQKIGIAQQGAGKGVVRGVLGLPGRFVGGIWGGNSAEGSASTASDNQSFADLWVDFLLKETEERERRESAEAINESKQAQNGTNSNAMATNMSTTGSGFSRLSSTFNQNQSSVPAHGYLTQPEHSSDSEFSTVPLTSSESNSRISRTFPRY